jgi:hypothetical protein
MVGLDGSYKGLVYRQPAPSIYFDDNAVIARPEAAQAQIDADMRRQAAAGNVVAPTVTGTPPGAGSHGQPTPPPPKRVTRYHGTVQIDPQRGNKEMATIIEEIVQRLTGLTGTDVTITVEISASREAGFDDATIRTISENSRTLKFRSHGFEGE